MDKKLKTALTGAAFAMLLAGQAYAQAMNEPPPAGPVILNLDGQTVPHAYQDYTVSFTPTTSSDYVSFAFRDDPEYLYLSDVTLTAAGVGPNLLINGDFSAGPVGSPAPTGWTYLNTFGATFGGVVGSGCGVSGDNCYVDGAVQAYDAITQNLSLTVGQLYTLTFSLDESSSQATFSALSTNGDSSDNGGNGLDLVVYAGSSVPVSATPLPAALPLFMGGLGAMGLLARRRKRKDAAAFAAA